MCRWACALREWACLTAAESQPAHPCPPEARFSAPFLISLCLNAFPSPHSSFRMVVTPYMRGFDRPMALVFLSLLSTCAAAGGFVWTWGSQGQSCTDACQAAYLVCVEEFTKIGSQASFEAAKGAAVSCSGGYSGGFSYSNDPMKYSDGRCFWPTGTSSTCASSGSDYTRLCSCQCPAGSFSPSNTQPYPCTR